MAENEKEPNAVAEDLLSQLPESLIYHIFSFLSTDYIVRMNIVSKRWKQMWVSAPFIHFEYFCHIINDLRDRETFLKLVSDCLRYRKLNEKVSETSITRFQFHTSYSYKPADGSGLKDWLHFVIPRNVEELDLNVRCYSLPPFVLNASSLTVLKLAVVNLEDLSLSNLPSLKVLSFKYVRRDATSLQNVISGCPVIEDLQVRGFYGLQNVDFAVGETLKYLSLYGVGFTRQWLEGLISGLPLLERLAVEYCDKENISIHSHSLKSLYYRCRLNSISIHSHSLKGLSIAVRDPIHDDSFSFEGTFITPNLVCLRLVCGVKSVIYFEAPNLLEADLTLQEDNSMLSNDGIVHFLSNLSSVEKMVLCICEQDIIFSESTRSTCSPPLPNLKHLKVKIKNVHDELKKSEIADSVYWCAPSLENLEIEEEILKIEGV